MSEYMGMTPRLVKNRTGKNYPNALETNGEQWVYKKIESDWTAQQNTAPQNFADIIKQGLERRLNQSGLEQLKNKYGIELPKNALSRISYEGMRNFVTNDPSPTNPYTNKLVSANIGELKRARQQNAKLDFRKRLATESEKVLAIVMNIWFNKAAKTELASEYDDQLRGIDLILEKRGADEITLAVDVKTFEPKLSGTQNLHSKLDTLQRLYAKNVMPDAKYYKTGQGGYGPQMIEVVIPVDKKTLFELYSLIDPNDEAKMRMLINHPYRATFLELAETQIKRFKNILEQVRFTDDVKDEIELSLGLINDLKPTAVSNSPFESRTDVLKQIV